MGFCKGDLPPMLKGYSPELIELIKTMLSKKPEERPSVRSIPETALHKAPNIFVFGGHKGKKNPKITLKMPVVTVLSGKIELSYEVVHSQSHSSESSKTYVMGEDKCLSQEKPMAIGPLKTPTSLKDHDYKADRSSTAESLALQKEREPIEHNGEKTVPRDPPHLLPSLPTVGKLDVISTQKDAEIQSRVVTGSVSSSRSSETTTSKDQPLSEREGRQLKQSQDEILPSGP
ncbi:hypothetical protein Celaphus_00018291, partial [Cervus elaphus hippelaphus]